MASEKQIAANRANAQKSMGPKTTAGKLKSSQNAYQHGLSSPLRLDSVRSAKADAIVRALSGQDPNDEKLRSAVEFAAAQLELQRVRATRDDLMSKININDPDIHELQCLVALDRYERYAHTRRRRALAKVGGRPG